MDIKKYFENINKNILYRILKKKIKDQKLLWLINEIVFSNEGIKNLPIGNYTSQMFANIYLNDKLISEYTFTPENNSSPVLIDIPKEAVIEGRNYLKIETDLWSPTSFGSTDTRELGFSVSSIEFIPAD